MTDERQPLPLADDNADLRQRAAAYLQAHPEKMVPSAPEIDLQRLLQELQVHQIELEMQNEELRRSQEQLTLSQEKYADLYDFAPLAYFSLQRNGIIQAVNLTGASLLGVVRSQLVGSQFKTFAAPASWTDFAEHLEKVFGSQDYGGEETRQFWEMHLMPKGKPAIDVQVEALLAEDGLVCRLAITDINRRKQVEAQLKTALAEKEVLLRELYHRTKNNMQVISSLLNLQANSISDPQTLEIFREVTNRIQAMALVHQQLYQSQNLASIDLKDYINDLAILTLRNYQTNQEKIGLRMDLESVTISVDTAIPCALVINELISNAIKHGFPENKSGEIHIQLSHPENAPASDEIQITVADNGIGLPHGFDPRQSQSMGMQIIFGIIEQQLKGQVSFDGGPGAICRLRFRDNPHHSLT